MTISDDVVEQCRQTLLSIDDVLGRAALAPTMLCVRYLLPDGGDFESCWPLLREYFKVALPAATMMVVGLAAGDEDRDRGDGPQEPLMHQ